MRLRSPYRLLQAVDRQHLQPEVLLHRFGYALVPQLFRTRVYNDPVPSRRIHSTAWLDGLRGIAAICVFNFHFNFAFGDYPTYGWGYKGHMWFLELPIIRMFYLGLPMVNIFFVVAGYVIALRPLQMMHANTQSTRDALLKNLSSSVFRRFFRLYLPVFVMTFMVLVATRLHLFEFSAPLFASKALLPGIREKVLQRYDTLGEQLWYWATEMKILTSVWIWKSFYPSHDQHLWTIPTEFRSSLVLYLALLMVARARVNLRLGLLLIVSGYAFMSDRWEVALYLWGACIAQWDVMRAPLKPELLPSTAPGAALFSQEKPESNDVEARISSFESQELSNPRPIRTLISLFGFFFSLFLMCSPAVEFRATPGYIILSRFIPSWWTRPEKFWACIGSTLLVLILTHWSPKSLAHRVLTCDIVQYLGNISFSFYLVHGPLLHLFGYYVPQLLWMVPGIDRNTVPGWAVGMVLGWAFDITVSLWAADVFSREVDARCVRFTRWLERKCFVA